MEAQRSRQHGRSKYKFRQQTLENQAYYTKSSNASQPLRSQSSRPQTAGVSKKSQQLWKNSSRHHTESMHAFENTGARMHQNHLFSQQGKRNSVKLSKEDLETKFQQFNKEQKLNRVMTASSPINVNNRQDYDNDLHEALKNVRVASSGPFKNSERKSQNCQSQAEFLDKQLYSKSRVLSSHLCRRPVNVIIHKSSANIHQKSSPKPQETDAEVFLTKIGVNEYDFMHDKINSSYVNSESDGDVEAIFKETKNQKEVMDARNKVEAGLNKASDNLKDQLEDVRILKQFVQNQRREIHEQNLLDKVLGSKNHARPNIDKQYAVNTKLASMTRKKQHGNTGSFADKIVRKYAKKEQRRTQGSNKMHQQNVQPDSHKREGIPEFITEWREQSSKLNSLQPSKETLVTNPEMYSHDPKMTFTRTKPERRAVIPEMDPELKHELQEIQNMLARHRLDSQISNYDQATTATGNSPKRASQDDHTEARQSYNVTSNNKFLTRFNAKPQFQFSANYKQQGAALERPRAVQGSLSPPHLNKRSIINRTQPAQPWNQNIINAPQELDQLSTRDQLLHQLQQTNTRGPVNNANKSAASSFDQQGVFQHPLTQGYATRMPNLSPHRKGLLHVNQKRGSSQMNQYQKPAQRNQIRQQKQTGKVGLGQFGPSMAPNTRLRQVQANSIGHKAQSSVVTQNNTRKLLNLQGFVNKSTGKNETVQFRAFRQGIMKPM